MGHWALGKQVTSSLCPMPHSPCPKTPTQEWVEFFIYLSLVPGELSIDSTWR
ncbi:hypothetical protein [Nostoc sp.]|uniref:hypothetical protein n=1 Tax=Nostoc sp. TaxID=1180 RepID=UPI002FF6A8F5